MGDGWKAWKVTTVLWQLRKTLQSTLTTRFSADLINLCVTQFQGISLGGGVSQRCKQRKIKTSSERWNKTTSTNVKVQYQSFLQRKVVQKKPKKLESRPSVIRSGWQRHRYWRWKIYPRKFQTPSNSSYFDFRWKGNRWCSTYPTTLSPCSCLLYLRSCHRGATQHTDKYMTMISHHPP